MSGVAARVLFLMGLSGCTEYDLGSRSPGQSGELSQLVVHPPGTPRVTECNAVEPAPSGEAATQTCTAVEFSGSAMVLELEVSAAEGAFPMVLPNASGSADVWFSKLGVGFVSIGGNDGGEVLVRHDDHRDGSPVAFARQADGGLMALWREPGDHGGAFTRWWSDTGALVNSDWVEWLGGTVRWVDVDADGSPDVVGHSVTVRADGSTVAYVPGLVSFDTAMSASGDFDGDGRVEIANNQGVWDALTGALTPWEGLSGYTFQAAPVQIDGEVSLFGTDGSGAFRALPNGQVIWRLPLQAYDTNSIAVGDVDGDGVPEMAINAHDRIFVVNADGEELWSYDTDAGGTGSVIMADLDADGSYEVIGYGGFGLVVLAGVGGAVLAEDATVRSTLGHASAAVADVDGDGSAEIVVVGESRPEGDWVLRVYGAAEGRWARTRPVWNQLDYDVTSVQADGRIAPRPKPVWQTYNSFRAQPAHDGARPDLTVEATLLCCDEDTVWLALQVSNLGSADALAGGTVTVSTNDGSGWRAAASASLTEDIPAQTASEGMVLEIPRSAWGVAQVVEVDGVDEDECDLVNDRVPVDLVCGD